MEGVLLPIETVLDGIPALAVDGEQAQRLRLGQTVPLGGANVSTAAEAVLGAGGGKPLGLRHLGPGMGTPRRLL